MEYDDEDQRRAYWECVEEDRPEELEELVDMPLSESTLDWLYNEPFKERQFLDWWSVPTSQTAKPNKIKGKS